MSSRVGSEHEEGLAMGKTYNCKICEKAFSSGRVLGGHVRCHMAAMGLTAQKGKSPVVAEKSESSSCLTDRASDDGRHNSGKGPRNSVESFGTGENKVYAWSCENQCDLCNKRFKSRRALFGHMRVHCCNKQRGGGQGDRHATSLGGRVPSAEVATSARKSWLEEALSEGDIVCPTMRRKRSIRARWSGTQPGNNVAPHFGMSLSTLLSSGFHEDEIEAAIGLSMISMGVGSWKYSDVVKNSSGFLQIGNEGQILDDLLVGVGDKRRRLGEVDDAAPKLLKVPGYTHNLIDSDVNREVIKCQTSCDMISGGVEVQSFRSGGVVEEMRSLVVHVLEVEKIPDLSSDDELGGGKRKRMLPDTDCRRSVLTFERRGYKCKSCGRIFLNQQELGDHRVTSCCSSVSSEKTEDKKVNGERNPSPSHTNGLDLGRSCGKVFLPGEALSGHSWSDDNKESEAVASERVSHGALLLDLNLPAEVLK